MRARRLPQELSEQQDRASEIPIPPGVSLPQAIGNHAFTRLIQRSFYDPGDNEDWIAGDRPTGGMTEADIKNYFQQGFKTYLEVWLNGYRFGKFFNTTLDKKHAEVNFMDAWRAHWKRAANKGYLMQNHELSQGVNIVEFTMNNSPCIPCSRKLADFLSEWNMVWGSRAGLKLYIRAQNVYGRVVEADTAIQNLVDAGISIESYAPQNEALIELDPFARKQAYVRQQRGRQARAQETFVEEDESTEEMDVSA